MKKLLVLILMSFPHLVSAQQVAKEIKQHYHYMDSLWDNDRYAELIEYARQVEPFFKANNKYPYYDYYRLLVSYLGDALISNGQFEEAEKTLFESLKIIESTVSRLHPAYSDALYKLGDLYEASGRYSKAYTYYSEAWKGAEIWRQFRWWKYIKLGSELINICANLGKYDDGEYYAKKIEESMPKAGYNNEELLDYYITRAVFYLQMTSLHKAEVYIKKANEIFPKAKPNIFTTVELKNALSMIWMATGRADSAETILSDLMNDLENLKMKNTEAYRLAAANLASVCFINRHNKKADSVLVSTLNNIHGANDKYAGALYLNLALVNLQEGAYKNALENIDKGLSIIDAYAKNEMQFNLPAKILKSIILLKLQNNDSAFSLYDQVMNGYISYIRENISHLSETEKNSLMLSYYNLANFAPSFISPVGTPAMTRRVEKAWEQQLFFKGLAAGEQTKLYRLLRQNKDTTISAIFAEWQELKKFIQSGTVKNKELDNISLLAEQKEKQLLLYLPDLKDKGTNNPVEELYKHLLPGEAIVDFSHYMQFTSSRVDSLWYGAYILRYDDPAPSFINICGEERITNLMDRRLPNSNKKIQPGAFYPPERLNLKHNSPGDSLYSLLWKPIQNQLHGIKTVFIVPDGILYKIRFHALPVSTGGYLCDKIDIRYLYHSNDICDTNFRTYSKPVGVKLWGGIRYDSSMETSKTAQPKLKKSKTDSLVNNDPDMVDKGYRPNTLDEVKTISRICNGAGIPNEIFSGTAATEQSFKQNFDGGNFDIIHIATHGSFDSGYFFRKPDFRPYYNIPFTLEKNPMSQVKLFMAGYNYLKSNAGQRPSNDGVLDASEIAQLNATQKKLIILSACQTGNGEVVSAEGVFGMVRAFKMAGADKMIISLADVDDAATKDMMPVLYKYIFDGMPIHIAFKKAQQYMRTKMPNPHYWSEFILIE